MLKLYNTLTRKKEIFKPIQKGKVGLYSCGPTVYWYQHIGNLRTYISNDILKRVLLYNGYKVKHVINVTDVGHLTSDADTGEDKIEKAAKREKKSAKQIADFYFKIFKQDLKKLNIIEADIWPKATEHIKEMIDLIKILVKKGYTYKTSDGIYFDSSKFKDYGKLARLKKEKLKAGKRIDVGEKKHSTDFVLWKFSQKPGIRQQEWKSPWGIGFPGWHIECSAMSMKYLGENFDIHVGGMDHIPVHHTNEIAQSEAATGKKFVNYWIHGAWLLFRGEKVSKSKGGLYTISELEKEKFNALAFRYLCLTIHYRKPLNFTLKNLKKSQDAYQRLRRTTLGLKNDKEINKEYLKKFEEAMNNDLNTSKALQIMWKLVRDGKAQGKYRAIKKIDEVFGLSLLKIDIPKDVEKLKKERDNARKKKNWKKADELRRKINKYGYTIDDTKEGSFISGIKLIKIK